MGMGERRNLYTNSSGALHLQHAVAKSKLNDYAATLRVPLPHPVVQTRHW